MKVKVKLFATLRKDKFAETDFVFNKAVSIMDLVNHVGLDQKDIAIIFVNGKHGDFNQVLNDNDEVAFFPPIGGG